MARLRYCTGRRMITSALYSAGKEPAMKQHGGNDCANEKQIITDRLACVIASIDKSPLLREELIACGLAPALLREGLQWHIKYLKGEI